MPGMPPPHRTASRAIAALVVALAFTTSLAAGGGAQAPAKDEHPTLPQGEGRELVIRVCSACHAPEMVVDQQMDAAGWTATVDQMAGNGADATEAEFAQIVQYLVKAFPAK